MKRQIYGINHWMSDKHFRRYLADTTWRYSRRDLKVTVYETLSSPALKVLCLEGSDRMIDKKSKKDVAIGGVPFDEALSRFLTVSPRDLAVGIEADVKQARQRIDKVREDIENVGRSRKGRFRL